MTPGPVTLETLTDGGQRPEDVGMRIADWISQTQRTLDLALYSVHVPGPVGDRVGKYRMIAIATALCAVLVWLVVTRLGS